MSDPTRTAHTCPHKDAKRAVFSGLAVSLAVHIAIIAAVLLGAVSGVGAAEEQAPEERVPFTPAELVRLGEEALPSAMPARRVPEVDPQPAKHDSAPARPAERRAHKAQPPKRKTHRAQPQRATATPSKHNAPNHQDANPSARDILGAFEGSSRQGPNRRVNTTAPRGHREGVAEGTVEDPALKHLLATYGVRVMHDVKRRWSVPTVIPAEEAKVLSAMVFVKLSADGHVVHYALRKRSGNAHFDMSVERAVKAFQPGGARLTMPTDPRLKAEVLRRGLRLRSWKFTGR